MRDQHLTRREILALIEGAVDSTDNAEMWTHIEDCATCTGVFDELMLLSLSDASVLEHVKHDDDEAEFFQMFQSLDDDGERGEREARAADAFFVQLAQHPVDQWAAILGEQPQGCTSALVLRLVDAAAPEVFRQPQHALVLLRVAESVALALDEAASLRSRGHVWKQRANALRMLGRYEEAIDAAIVSEKLYAELQQPDTPYEVGQARYTMAVALFEMTRYEAALRAATSARELLDGYGMSAPLAKVLMLEAYIRAEWGDVASARETLRALLPIEEQLGQPFEVGRVRANLAECNLRLGDLDAAMQDARAAIETFRALGNVTEETRGEWIVAMIRLARGEREAMERLYEVAAVYRGLRMPGEAGFVNLDLTAELLERGEWTEAEILARELVTLFTAAGVTLASVNALHYLLSAVKNREATTATIRYIRKYVAADRDPARPFEPPESTPN
jgi:tetratricopeptide (TPR) repeat protein